MADDVLLLETGDHLLLEAGDALLLEAVVIRARVPEACGDPIMATQCDDVDQ